MKTNERIHKPQQSSVLLIESPVNETNLNPWAGGWPGCTEYETYWKNLSNVETSINICLLTLQVLLFFIFTTRHWNFRMMDVFQNGIKYYSFSQPGGTLSHAVCFRLWFSCPYSVKVIICRNLQAEQQLSSWLALAYASFLCLAV